MIKLVRRRLLMAVPLLFIVSVLTFILQSLAPGDLARELLGVEYTPAGYAQLRRQLGLDEPIYAQYWHWLDHVFHGSLGTSAYSGQPVSQALNQRIGVTLSLVIATLVVSSLVGVTLGTISALRKRGVIARCVDVLSLVGEAVPHFWAALVLIDVFAVSVHWFPATGYVAPGESIGEWARSLVLPVVTLSLGAVAPIAKLTRDSMLDVLERDFIIALRSRGVPERTIIIRHALRAAAAPVVTMMGLLFVGLLSGTVLVESVFGLPGLGGLAVQSVNDHDLPMILGVAVYLTILVVIVNTLIDLAYGWLNPKVRTR
jgi:peptide/nickel transport system permease protein